LKPDGLLDGSQRRRPTRQNELRRARGNLVVFYLVRITRADPNVSTPSPLREGVLTTGTFNLLSKTEPRSA